jgi:hypothetical protein
VQGRGGSGSEPTRLKFTGIQTGRYTRRCTSSGRDYQDRSGAQGGAQALAVCQDRSEPTRLKVPAVHKAVHQLWLSARIVRVQVGAQGGAQALAVCQDRSEVEHRVSGSTTGKRTRQIINRKSFLFGCLCVDGGERRRPFPPRGGENMGSRSSQVNTVNSGIRQSKQQKQGSRSGDQLEDRGSGRTESGATADSRRDQDDPIRRQSGSVRYRHRKVRQRFDIQGFGGSKEFLGILGSGWVSRTRNWQHSRKSKTVLMRTVCPSPTKVKGDDLDLFKPQRTGIASLCWQPRGGSQGIRHRRIRTWHDHGEVHDWYGNQVYLRSGDLTVHIGVGG